MQSDGEQIMVGTGEASFAGMVRSNKTAAFIVDCLKTETTKAQIVDAMMERYDAPHDVIERDVERILQQLKAIDAIAE